jgi:hypothetical protein
LGGALQQLGTRHQLRAARARNLAVGAVEFKCRHARVATEVRLRGTVQRGKGKESIENRIKKVFVNICYLFLVLVVTFKCDLQSIENHQQ